MRLVTELRDPWAIALAQAAAFLTYLLFAAPLWQSLAAAGLVLGARVVGGLTLPVPTPTIPPLSVLNEPEQAVARYAAIGRSIEFIAQRMESSEKVTRRRKQSVMTKLGFDNDWELRVWATTVGLIPEPPAPHWYDRTLVRGTLAGGSLIGLCWTIYQILRTTAPQIFH